MWIRKEVDLSHRICASPERPGWDHESPIVGSKRSVLASVFHEFHSSPANAADKPVLVIQYCVAPHLGSPAWYPVMVWCFSNVYQ